jgi:acylglycerol lipase
LNWQTSDGLELYAQLWEPEQKPRGVVCLVHGLGEHCGRYGHLGTALTRAGYALSAYDLRGHGKSEGQRGHAPSWDALLDDIALSLDKARQRYPGTPQFLYGHSFGASLVLTYALQRQPQIAGVIATGPLLRPAFQPPAWKTALGKALYQLWPTFALNNEVDPKAVSRDPNVVEAYVNDPLVHDRVSARMGMDLLNKGTWALEHASEFKLPLLLMNGDADALCSPRCVGEFARSAGALCTYKAWPGLFHEIHNEPEQEQVFDYLISWLNEHTPS